MASFEKRGKKWRAVVSYTDARGLRQKTSKTFELKKAATAWAAETETKVNGGLDINAGNISFQAYFINWVETYKRGTVRESTFSNYMYHYNKICEIFGDAQLNKLTTSFIQKRMNDFGKNHSKNYVKSLLTSIKSSLKDALIDGLIERDIFTRLKPVGQDPKDFDNYLSADEFYKLHKWLYDHKNIFIEDNFYLAVLIAIETGARYGEIQALTVNDFDFKHNTMTINKSYSKRTNQNTLPKNKYSVRTITITNQLSDVVKWYSTNQKSMDIFVNHHDTKKLYEGMKRLSDLLNIAFIRFHGLRHSHVSYLLHKNIDISYISKRVGHANISITLKIYSHLLKEKENEQERLTQNVLYIDKKISSPQ